MSETFWYCVGGHRQGDIIDSDLLGPRNLLAAGYISLVFDPTSEEHRELLKTQRVAEMVTAERLFEDIRVSEYPSRPSRTTCLFATEDMELWQTAVSKPGGCWYGLEPIQELQRFSPDAGWLDIGIKLLYTMVEDISFDKPTEIARYARSYWEGEVCSHDTPTWGQRELLLVGKYAIQRL